jgi:CBS domain-containing protein
MKIKNVMTRTVETVRPDQTLQEAAAKMKALDVGPMPVTEGDRLVGILTDRDIVVRAVADGRDSRTTKVRDAMTSDVVCCNEEDSVKDAASKMKDRQIRRIVVVDAQQRVSGIVSLGDIAVDTHDDKMSGQVLEEVSKPSHQPAGRVTS